MKREALSTVVALIFTIIGCPFTASAQWQQINEDGFGVGAWVTKDLVVFNDNLYAATSTPAKLFRLGDLSEESWFHWTEIRIPVNDIVPDTGEDSDLELINALAVFRAPGDRWPWLYAAVKRGAKSFLVRTQNSVTWSLASDIWDFREHGEALELEVFRDQLYVSIGDTYTSDVSKMRLHRTANGLDWETVPSEELAFGAGDHWIEDLEVYDGYLYAGASGHNESIPGDHVVEVWRSRDGMTWTRIDGGALTSPTVSEVESMESFGGYLYVGTKNHYGLTTETSVPELWRFNGELWDKIETVGQFHERALHVDTLHGHHGVLYAGLGGGGRVAEAYGRIYRSLDGENWEQITPEGITAHPERTYAADVILGIGEYLYFTAGHEDTGTQIWRLANLRSDIAPSLARHDGEPYLFHRTPRPAGNIRETVLRDNELISRGPVHDQNVARSRAFTAKQPLAFGYDHHGLLLAESYLQLVYRGHNNSRIWHTRKRNTDGRHWYWQTPASIPDVRTDRAPGATAFNWAGPAGPQLTVAYTDRVTGRIQFRVKEGTRWSPVYSLPEAARSSNGPEIISFDGSLYIFYRGYGDDNWLYVARKESTRASDNRWETSRLRRAFTRSSTTDRAVSAVLYDGSLIVAYVGHNNDYIWLRRSTDGVNWDRLGYVRGLVSDHNPDLTVAGGRLYLAFKPASEQEICIGTLEIDTGNRHDTPGHTWRSLRPISCGS